MPEILVRGHAEALLAPTDAALTITVHVRTATTQADAVAQCARRCQAVDALVDARRGELVRRATTSSIRTGPEWDHSGKGGPRLVGYFATRSSQLDCAPDGEGLTALLAEVGRLEEVQLSGPSWRVAPGADGWDGMRAEAAADARRRAQAYAGGLGMTVGRITWLAEPGLRRGGGGGEAGMMVGFERESGVMTRSARGGGAEEPPVLVQIQPEPQTVEVTVEAAFDLS